MNLARVRRVALTESADTWRDPFVVGWIAAAALASHLLTFAVGVTHYQYWLRLTFVLIPLSLFFLYGRRRHVVEELAFERASRGVPKSSQVRRLGEALGQLSFPAAYLVLVSPQIVLFLLYAPHLVPEVSSAIVTFILLNVSLVIGAGVGPSAVRRPWVKAVIVGVLFVLANLTVLLDSAPFAFRFILQLTGVGAWMYAAHATLDTVGGAVSALTTAFVFSLLWGASLWRAKGFQKPIVLTLLACGLLVAAYASAAEIEQVDSQKVLILDSDFTYEFQSLDGGRLTMRAPLAIGEATQVRVVVATDQPLDQATRLSLSAEGLAFHPNEFDVPARSQRFEAIVSIEPSALEALRSQKYLVSASWQGNGEALQGETLLRADVPALWLAFIWGGSMAALGPVIFVAARRARANSAFDVHS